MTEQFEEWAIVELMGHRRLAGHVSDVPMFGTSMLRLRVPAKDPAGGWRAEQFYGAPAIYCVTPCDEDTARKAANPPTWEEERAELEAADLDDEVTDRVKCETCDGSGIHIEFHEHGATEALGCQDCRGRGWVDLLGVEAELDHPLFDEGTPVGVASTPTRLSQRTPSGTAPCDDCGKPVEVPDDHPVDWAYCPDCQPKTTAPEPEPFVDTEPF